jgi:hypothetical protein
MEIFKAFVQCGDSDELWMLLKVYAVNRRLAKVKIIADELQRREDEDALRTQKQVKGLRGGDVSGKESKTA